MPVGAWGEMRILGPSPTAHQRGILHRLNLLSDDTSIDLPSTDAAALGTASAEIIVPWAKCPEYPPFFPQESFVTDFFDWFSRGVGQQATRFVRRRGGLGWLASTTKIEAAAVCYPEEFEYRDYSRSNWLVVIRTEDKVGIQTSRVLRPFVLPSPQGSFQRIPRLKELRKRSVAVIGLGAVGSQVAVELARAGVGRLKLIDGDILEPANLVRHACTLQQVGLPKSTAVANQLRLIAPKCEVRAFSINFGATDVASPDDTRRVNSLLYAATETCDMIIGAAADEDVNYLISRVAADQGIAQVYAWGTNGGYGGEVVRVVPKSTGCFECFLLQQDEPLHLVKPDEAREMVPALGCADRTFTGSGFDMNAVAMFATRLAVQTLLRDEQAAYPDADYDYISWNNIGDNGRGLPAILDRRKIPPSTECRFCSGS